MLYLTQGYSKVEGAHVAVTEMLDTVNIPHFLVPQALSYKLCPPNRIKDQMDLEKPETGAFKSWLISMFWRKEVF